MSVICGFNGFNHISSIKSFIHKESNENETKSNLEPVFFEFQGVALNNINQIGLSWSFIILVEGSTLSICGFYGGKTSTIQSLKTPNNCTIQQLSCNRRDVVCITSDGGCWQFNLVSEQWRDLAAVLFSQQDRSDDENNMNREPSIKACCGETLTAVLNARGEVYNVPNKLSLPGVKIVDIACGRSHILMLSENGDVYSVGEGSRGQLGHGELDDEEEPKLVEGLAGLRVVAISCGGWHSCALTADGDLYTWGWDMCGQLGLGGEECKSKVAVQALPQAVDWPNVEDVKVVKVACGARHTVAILDNGTVWGCGWNKYGQLALHGVDSVSCMTQLPTTPGEFRQVVCGPWNTCLLV